METYNAMSQQKVIEMLCQAYRSHVPGAEEAAQEFAYANGLRLVKVDLGDYGDTLGFEDK